MGKKFQKNSYVILCLADKLENIQETRLSGSDEDSCISGNIKRSNQDDLDGDKSEEEKSVSESDILAELNANLAKIAEKDKNKAKKPTKKAMFTVAIEDPEENKVETEIELRIDPSKLLKVSKKAYSKVFARPCEKMV